MTEEQKKQLEEIATEAEKTYEIDQAHLDLAPARYGGPGKNSIPKRYQPEKSYAPARYGGAGKSGVPARYK